ncbi:MAG: transcriptional repressor [Clostridiales bacterium]|nr:transcriptional repressor [Clostridiales bacterium]
MLKYSRQREAIKNFLMTRTDHPTADMIYMHIKHQFPNISLGTVYRNLALLLSLGEISKINCGDGSVHFDPVITPHYHFFCNECGSVQDINISINTNLDILASENFSGEIEHHSIIFYGKCANCSNNKIDRSGDFKKFPNYNKK